MVRLHVAVFFISILALATAQALTLRTPYLVQEIQPDTVDGQNLIILKDYPSVLKVKRSQEKVFACLQKSLHEKVLITLEITKQQDILDCR